VVGFKLGSPETGHLLGFGWQGERLAFSSVVPRVAILPLMFTRRLQIGRTIVLHLDALWQRNISRREEDTIVYQRCPLC
jgi:hypothetical protein